MKRVIAIQFDATTASAIGRGTQRAFSLADKDVTALVAEPFPGDPDSGFPGVTVRGNTPIARRKGKPVEGGVWFPITALTHITFEDVPAENRALPEPAFEPPAEVPEDEPSLEDLTVAELRKVASDRGVSGYANLKKAELVDVLTSGKSARE